MNGLFAFLSVAQLQVLWFLMVGAMFVGYAILDGFDLGVGTLHLLSRTDEHRRMSLNAIGPFWDGNEVWLVVGGGGLFAAFPAVYASAMSGFYLPVILLLVLLIFRAVAIEFRSKQPMAWWRTFWDTGFTLSSTGTALTLGLIMGNVAQGIPLDRDGNYTGTLLALLNPYALLTGVATVALFAMHGAIYLVLKTEGELHEQARQWTYHAIASFVALYVLLTMVTLLYVPNLSDNFRHHPAFLGIAALNLLAVANIPREMFLRRDGRAFVSSCVSIVLLLGLFGIGCFPDLLHASNNPALSLSLYNSSSSPLTLRILTLIGIIGIPLVLAYTFTVHWIFRGKVKLESHSY